MTEDIILAAIAKEDSAITYLYNETYNSVYQAIRPLIKDEDTVLDILQDTYIKAFESLEQLEKPEQFRAWVKRIAQNKSKDWLKKKKPTLFSEMRPDDESGEIDFLDDREFAQPDVTLDKEETRRLLWEIIDSLSDDQRLVVNMYYFQDMQIKEIALELGLSENTVKSRLNYARKNIESKVIVLEKQGTKLYSLAPLPLLLWLFRSATETPSAAALSEITGTLSTSGGAVAASSAGSASSTAAATSGAVAAGTTGGAAGASIVTKIVAGIVAAAIAIGGGALLYQTLKPDDEPAEVVSVMNGNEDISDEATLSPSPSPDAEDAEAEEPPDNDARIASFVHLAEGHSADTGNSYYALYDVDGDGLDELFHARNYEGIVSTEIFTVDEQNNVVSIFSPGEIMGRVPSVFYELVTYEGAVDKAGLKY